MKLMGLFAGLFFLNAFAVEDIKSTFDTDLRDYEELNLGKDEFLAVKNLGSDLYDIANSKGLKQNQVEKRMDQFFNHIRSKKFAESIMLFTNRAKPQNFSEFKVVLKDYTGKVMGPGVSGLLDDLLGVEEFANAVKLIYQEIPSVLDPIKCKNAVYVISGELGYVLAFAAATYYMPGMGKPAGLVARQAAQLIIRWTNSDEKLCKIIHDNFYYMKEELFFL